MEKAGAGASLRAGGLDFEAEGRQEYRIAVGGFQKFLARKPLLSRARKQADSARQFLKRRSTVF
jgi:hypothetical protein